MHRTTDDERTDALYEILDEAVTELEAVGFKGPAPYRAMVSYLLDRLSGTLCQDHLRADLTRIAALIEQEIAGLPDRTP